MGIIYVFYFFLFQRFAQFYDISWRDLEILAVLIESKDKSGVPLQITPQLCDEVYFKI